MKSKNLTGYLVDVLDDLSGPITISNTLDMDIFRPDPIPGCQSQATALK